MSISTRSPDAPGTDEDTPLACATGKIRLFVAGPDALGEGVRHTLPPEQSHYLANVMRVSPGARVLLFNGRDGEWSATVSEVRKKAVSVTCEALVRAQDRVPDLTLLFAPVKKAPLDFLVQKAVELGVARLQPVFTARTIVSRVKLERIAANAVEAAEQCGRLTVPEVLEPARLDAVLSGWPEGARLLFCDEAGPGEPDVPPALEALRALPGEERGPWSILIGPEGGFDSRERDRLMALPGHLRVSLGPRIMRADTAAIAALTLWQAALGDLSSA